MIGIVGAGITGLTLHHELAQRGVESRVFEAAAEPGGVMRSTSTDGFVLERGPQRTRLTPAVRRLVDAVGLEDRLLEAVDAPLYVYHDGKLRRAPLSPRAAVTTDLLSWRGKLRVLLEPLTSPPRAGESVEGYLTRAFGREFATRLGGLLYAGLYASDPAAMPVEHSLARALDRFGIDRSILAAVVRSQLTGRDPPPVVSFEAGLQELPTALYEQHADHVSLHEPVRELYPRGDGYELGTPARTVGVDQVVFTTPAPVTASLLDAVDAATARALDALTYNPLALVYLDADTSLEGAGHQVPFAESAVTLGATWNDGLFGSSGSAAGTPGDDGRRDTGREGLVTCYLGGAKTPGAVDWSTARLEQTAADEFETMTGVQATPVAVHRIVPGMPAYDRSWSALASLDVPDALHLCANYESRAGIPGRLRRATALAESLAADGQTSRARPESAAVSTAD